jgi:hypothetical protein
MWEEMTTPWVIRSKIIRNHTGLLKDVVKILNVVAHPNLSLQLVNSNADSITQKAKWPIFYTEFILLKFLLVNPSFSKPAIGCHVHSPNSSACQVKD